MAFASLRFPEDIKWTRRCVTEEMMDEAVCGSTGPPRWRSSIAVFEFEPEKDEQSYPGQTISYLKVALTVTGYQADGDEIDVPDSSWEELPGIEDFRNVLDEYYPCYAALVDVSVGPPESSTEVPLSDYPFFVQFEPKKREMLELVSETGERASRSVEGINIRSGETSIESTESVDKWNAKAGLSLGPFSLGGGVAGENQKVDSTEKSEVSTSDSLEEQRNALSRTTNLTQMYSLLQTYHLGTNRGVFVMQPRPHTVQGEFSFVNGPRELEGVQELFFVVMRPESQERPCVKVDLETAHIGFVPTFINETREEQASLFVFPDGVQGGRRGVTEKSFTYSPPPGWDIVSWVEESFSLVGGGDYTVTYDPSFLRIDGVLEWTSKLFNEGGKKVLLPHGHLNVTVTVRLRKRTPTQSGEAETLFLTGRRLCCCDGRAVPVPDLSRWVGGETDLSGHAMTFPNGPAVGDNLLQARKASSTITREAIKLLTGSRRYPIGKTHFYETDMFQRRLSEHLRRQKVDLRVGEDLAAQFAQSVNSQTLAADFLRVPSARLARNAKQPPDQIRRERLRSVLKGLNCGYQPDG